MLIRAWILQESQWGLVSVSFSRSAFYPNPRFPPNSDFLFSVSSKWILLQVFPLPVPFLSFSFFFLALASKTFYLASFSLFSLWAWAFWPPKTQVWKAQKEDGRDGQKIWRVSLGPTCFSAAFMNVWPRCSLSFFLSISLFSFSGVSDGWVRICQRHLQVGKNWLNLLNPELVFAPPNFQLALISDENDLRMVILEWIISHSPESMIGFCTRGL